MKPTVGMIDKKMKDVYEKDFIYPYTHKSASEYRLVCQAAVKCNILIIKPKVAESMTATWVNVDPTG